MEFLMCLDGSSAMQSQALVGLEKHSKQLLQFLELTLCQFDVLFPQNLKFCSASCGRLLARGIVDLFYCFCNLKQHRGQNLQLQLPLRVCFFLVSLACSSPLGFPDFFVVLLRIRGFQRFEFVNSFQQEPVCRYVFFRVHLMI